MKYIIYTMISMLVLVCWGAEEQKRIIGTIYYPQFVTFAHENNVVQEYLDLSVDESIHDESFVDLIKKQKNKDRACIFARLCTTTKNNITVSYLDTNQLNRWWFGDRLYPEDAMLDGIEQDRRLAYKEFPNFERHPANKLPVRGEVPYFIAKHGGDDDTDDDHAINFHYIGSSYDVISKDMKGHYVRALLAAHYSKNSESDACQQAYNFLARVYTGKIVIPDVKVNEKLAKYYRAKTKRDSKNDLPSNCSIS